MGYVKCCRTCGHSTKYNLGKASEKIECMTKWVDPNGICDRFQPNISPTQIMKKIDEGLKRLERIEDGKYELTVRPPFGKNYRVQGAKAEK